MAGYGEFAGVYDVLTENVPYDRIAGYYDEIIRSLGVSGGVLCDAGCGTGSLTVRLKAMGYDVIGVDASADMLSYAAAKDPSIRWICQNMTELSLYGEADVIISTLDCINHLSGAAEMERCFKRFAKNLRRGGLLLFDVNTIYKHREILADNTFIYDMPGIYCAWNNTYSEKDNGVDIELDLFFEEPDGRYYRGGESFRETALKREDMRALTEKAGFAVERELEYLTPDPPKEKSEKLMFAARKL